MAKKGNKSTRLAAAHSLDQVSGILMPVNLGRPLGTFNGSFDLQLTFLPTRWLLEA